jgi:hypothetical protein
MSKDHLSPTMSKEDEMGQDDLNFLFIFITSILEVITIFASKLKAKLQKGISQNTNMLAGHFTTALMAHQKFPKGTLLFFIIASQFQDIMWFTLHYFGIEHTGPNDVLDTTLSTISVDMLFSHDLLPQVFWLILIFIIGKVLFKSNKIGLVSAGLVLVHFLLDLFSGHAHHIFGAESQDIAFGFYATNPFLAIAIEAVFTVVTLSYFFKKDAQLGIIRTQKNKAAIIGLFVFGVLFMLSIATTSFRELFGLPDFNLGFNSNVPTLIMTYVGMILYLNHFVPKFKTETKSL